MKLILLLVVIISVCLVLTKASSSRPLKFNSSNTHTHTNTNDDTSTGVEKRLEYSPLVDYLPSIQTLRTTSYDHDHDQDSLPLKVQPLDLVTVSYSIVIHPASLKGKPLTLIESTHSNTHSANLKSDSLKFTVGNNEIFPEFEASVIGARVNERRSVTFKAEEGELLLLEFQVLNIESVTDVFARADQNSNGCLDSKELTKHFLAQGVPSDVVVEVVQAWLERIAGVSDCLDRETWEDALKDTSKLLLKTLSNAQTNNMSVLSNFNQAVHTFNSHSVRMNTFASDEDLESLNTAYYDQDGDNDGDVEGEEREGGEGEAYKEDLDKSEDQYDYEVTYEYPLTGHTNTNTNTNTDNTGYEYNPHKSLSLSTKHTGKWPGYDLLKL